MALTCPFAVSYEAWVGHRTVVNERQDTAHLRRLDCRSDASSSTILGGVVDAECSNVVEELEEPA